MKKTFIATLVILASGIVLYSIISAVHDLTKTRQFMARSMVFVNAAIIKEQFRLSMDPGYKLTIIQRSNNPIAHNGYFTFRKQINNTDRATVVIGNFDLTDKFNDFTKFLDYKITSPYPVSDYCEGEDFKWNFIYPLTIFNSRIVPKGDTLEIYGMSVDSSNVIDHPYVKEYRYVGKFEDIGFAIKDETLFIRNVPVVLHTDSPKYGSLSFLVAPDKKVAFMIYFVNCNNPELYAQSFEGIKSTLDSIQVYGYPGRSLAK